MSKFTDRNIRWVLPVITAARYLFLGLLLIGLTVWSFDAQNTTLGHYFSDRITDALFRTWITFELFYWILRYKKNSTALKEATR